VGEEEGLAGSVEEEAWEAAATAGAGSEGEDLAVVGLAWGAVEAEVSAAGGPGRAMKETEEATAKEDSEAARAAEGSAEGS
jgi:hypothetical protein